jgi:hypothetical protein
MRILRQTDRAARRGSSNETGFYGHWVNSTLPIAIVVNSAGNIGVCNAMSAPIGNGGFTGAF